MWWTDYIKEIQKQLIEKYGLKENPDKPGVPINVPDGEYPMEINGKIDKVRAKNNKTSCCNFGK